MVAIDRIDVIRARLDGAVEMRRLRESMRELSEAARPPQDEPSAADQEGSGARRPAEPGQRP